jgi:hypothetical protein
MGTRGETVGIQSKVAALLRCLPLKRRAKVVAEEKPETESVAQTLEAFVGQVKAETKPFAAAELHEKRGRVESQDRPFLLGAVFGAVSGCIITLVLVQTLMAPKLGASVTPRTAFASHSADATASLR